MKMNKISLLFMIFLSICGCTVHVSTNKSDCCDMECEEYRNNWWTTHYFKWQCAEDSNKYPNKKLNSCSRYEEFGKQWNDIQIKCGQIKY